jgi:ParB/RepB/Spo0J family partition protein
MSTLLTVPIGEIKPDPKQPRKVFDAASLKSLADSIKQEGMINPVEVDSNFMIITGERRWRANQLLGNTTIQIIVNNKEYDEYERLRHQMAENIHQSSSTYDTMMNAMDTARAYKRMLDLAWEKNKTGEKYGSEARKRLADQLGVDSWTIKKFMDYLSQPEFVMRDIEQGRPRTYYNDTAYIRPEFRDKVLGQIAAGDFRKRDEIRDLATISRKLPDLARLEIQRVRQKESKEANRVLSGIANLGLAIEGLKNPRGQDKVMIERQLAWLKGMIEKYMKGGETNVK